MSENALRAVPVSYREAALALGTTPVKTIFKVTIPAAKSGILAGVIVYGVLVIALRILRAEDVRSIPRGEKLIKLLHLK